MLDISTALSQQQQAISQRASHNAYNSAPNMKAVEAAAEQFEAVFIGQMLQHMFTDISTDGLFGGGHAEEVMRSLLIDEYGSMIAREGGIGVSGQIKEAMLKLQEE